MTKIFQEQAKKDILDIIEKLNLNKNIKETSLKLLKKNKHFRTKPRNLAGSIIYLAGMINKTYISPEYIHRNYQYQRPKKRGLITRPIHLNKMSILSNLDLFILKSFEKNCSKELFGFGSKKKTKKAKEAKNGIIKQKKKSSSKRKRKSNSKGK